LDWEPQTYLCARAAPAPRIDGRLDDEAWTRTPWSEAFVDIEGPLRPPPRLATRMKMLWDDTFLYVAAELEEPHLQASLLERDSVIYHDNDFEVFLDPDADTHDYFELEINAFGTEWDLFLVKPYRDGGPALHEWDIVGLTTAVHCDGTLNDPADRDAGWTVEIALPWTALAEAAGVECPPRPGDQWRVNFSRVQWRWRPMDGGYEKASEKEDNWVWSAQGLVNMHYPEMWGIVEFAGDATAVATVAIREEDRVRAALREAWYGERRPASAMLSDGRRFEIRADGWVGESVR
jgi:hypothetical protein